MSSINDDNMATVSTKTTSSKLVHTNQEQQQDDNKSNGDSHREQHQLQSSTMINNKLRKSTMKKQQEEIDDLNMVENNESSSSSSNNVIKENSITMKEMKGHSISICIDSVDELETKNADDEIVTIMQESNNNDQSSMMINENVISSLSKQFIDGLIINDTNESNGKNRDNSVRPKSTHSMDGSLKKRSKPLIRSGAVRESSLSPSPPPIQLSNGGSNETLNLIKNVGSSTNHLTVAYSTVCGSIINNGNNTVSGNNISQPISLTTSSKNSSIISSNTSSPSLSRDSSSEIQEISVAEAKTFLTETLKKSLKDRQFLYKIEQDLAQFLNDTTRDTLKIQQTSSYNRMLIHKTADYYQLEHLVDQAHSSVILTKNSNTRQPDESFKEMIAKDQRDETIGQKKSILKRDSTSLDDSPGSSFDKDKSPDNSLLLNGGGASLVSGGSGCGTGSLSDSSRSRSLEEREENYEKVRARIFSQQDAKDADSSSSQSSKSKLQLQTGNEENSDNKLIQSPQQPVDSSSLDSNSQNNNCDTNENVLEIIDTNITNIVDNDDDDDGGGSGGGGGDDGQQKQPLIDKKENNNNNSQQMMQRRKPQNSYVGSNSNRNGGKSGGYTGRVNKYHNMYHHQSYQHHQSAQPPFHPPPATQPYYNYQPQSYHQSSSSHQSAASYRPANLSHHHHHQNQYHSQRFDSSNHNNNNSNHQHPHSRGPYRSNVMNNNPKNNPYHQTSGGGGGYNARHSHPGTSQLHHHHHQYQGGTGNFGSHHRMNHPSSMSSIHQLSNQQPPAHHLMEQQSNPYAPYLRVPGVTAYNPYMDPNANNQYQYLHSIPNEQFYTYMNQSAMGGIQQPPSHSTPLLANPPTHQILPHQSSTNVPPNNTNITSTAGQPNHQYTLSIANGYPMMYGPNIQSAMQHQSNPNSHVPYSHPHPHSLVPPSQANVSPSYSIINPYGTIPMNLIAQPKMDETIQSSQQKTDIRRNQLGPNGHQLNNGQPPPIDTSLSYDRIAQVHYPHTCKANSQPQAAIHNVCYNIPTNVNTANEVKNSPIIGSSIKTNKQKCQQQYSMTGHGNGGSHQHQQQLAKQSRSTARNHDNSNNTQQQTNKLVTKMATSK